MHEQMDAVLTEIIERELAMFLATPNLGGQSECQNRPQVFRLMRGMAHSAHGPDFLESYLDDLREAEKSGKNFMIEKYARMDNLLPPLSNNPLLDEIADAETAFLEAAIKEKPGFFKDRDNGMFRHYLRCELETLSQRSLELYAREMEMAINENRNPALERHAWLEAKLG